MKAQPARNAGRAHHLAHRPNAGSLFQIAALVILMASAAAAQFGGGFGGFGPRYVPARFPDAETFGHGFVFCRGIYRSDRREAGGTGWSTDYPDAELNFSIRLSELTKARVHRGNDGKPVHVTVRLTDDALFKCPYLHMEDVGTMALSEEEVRKLREYLLKGGFLWVDDYWGEWAWEQWVQQIGRVLPPGEYPIVDLPIGHPIWRSQFVLKELPQIPAIQQWRRLGFETSERGEESRIPHFRGIADKDGRVFVVMTHNTDISDAWEREGEDPRYFYQFSPKGYGVGIDVMLYAMTH
jgi:hypothetical protein